MNSRTAATPKSTPQAGYIRVKKSFQGKKPLTTRSLTEKGKAAFSGYAKALESYLPSREKSS